MGKLNRDGQPDEVGFNWRRRRDCGVNELLGVCRGVLADGVLVYEEVEYLFDWLQRREPVRKSFIGKELYEALHTVVAKGCMSPSEETALVDFLLSIIGGTPVETQNDASYAMTLPLDNPPPPVVCAQKGFCFTGKFIFGTRNECQSAVLSRGGFVHPSPKRETSYLVIGVLASRDWAHSSCGRKIERAVELRQEGSGIFIVSESHWAECANLPNHGSEKAE